MKHLKLFFALFAMLALGVGNAWAEEVSIDFSQKGYSNQQAITDATITEGINVKFEKGSNSNPPKYYTSGAAIRAYGGNTFTISSTIGNITQIDLTFGSSDGSNAITTDAGDFSSSKWTGDANSVKFTIGGSSGNRRIKAIKVTYTPNSGGETPDPTTYTIKWHTAKGVTTDVTLNEGATITKPANDPTMTGYTFMGWTDQCSVAEDGTGFTALTDFGTADADKEFYAVFAVATTTGGGGSATETTATVTVKDYASANSWVNGTKYTSLKVDANITASVTGSSNTGKYYTSGNEWRIYQNENPTLTLTAAEGNTIKTAKVTYNINNKGVLKLNGANVTSGTASNINASSVTYNVGNTGTATNGQVKVTAIEVVYTSGSASVTTYSDYTTTCSGATVVETLTDAQFAWSAATAEATMGATNTFPTLTNTVPVSVTYESSTPATATIAADGTITLVAPGTTTISAKFAGGEVSGTTYAAKTVTYALTVLKAAAVPTDTRYVKVTKTANITDGEYLIVYETGNVAFDGSLETLDAVENTLEVTINNNTIAGTTYVDAATFTIDVTNGTILSASGKYIGKTANSNGLDVKTTAMTNTFAIDANGNAVITGNTAALRYNKAADQKRFRYYKDGGGSQEKIALYKKASKHTVTIADCTNGTVSAKMGETALATNDQVLSGIQITLSNEAAASYKLAAYDVYKTGDATTKVTVTDGKFIMPEFDVTISATFELAKTLTGLDITTPATQTTFWQGEAFNHDGLKVTAHFEGAEDEDVTSKITVTGSTATAGNQIVTVSYKEGEVTKDATYTITVKAIPNTKETAYSVADAYDIIDKLGTTSGVFISGIISQVDSYNSTYKSITYWISADGTTTKQLQVYSGKGLESADFSDKTDLSVGDQVIVCGNLKKFSETYEFDKNNYLASHTPTTKDPAGLAYATTEYTANVGEAFTTPELTNPHELVVTYSTSDASKATVDVNTGAVTIVAAGEVTITASTTGDATHDAGSASYTITITNPAMAVATLPFTFNSGKVDIENTAGMSQEGLGSDYNATTKLKFDNTDDWVIIHFDSEPGQLSYEIKGNGFSGGKFTVQQSADGSTYTEVVTYTELGDAVTKEHELAAESRYVKFIYTTKSSGNVGLGDIKITKFGETPVDPEVPEVPEEPTLSAAVYQKVTSAPADWSGEYILVYEQEDVTDCYVWNGKDENNGYIAATRNNDIISGAFATITIAPMTDGYSVRVNGGDKSGMYIGGVSNSNTISYSDEAILNTIEFSEDGIDLTSNTSVMRFNAASNTLRFRYYRSGQSAVQLYKKLVYTREVISGNFGTICLPYGSSNYSGAEFFEVAGKETGKVTLNSVKTLVAGTPYIFQATDSKISVVYEGEAAETALVDNGLHGTFEKIDDVKTTSAGKGYIIALIDGTCALQLCGENCWLDPYRAYLVIEDINKTKSPMPGCRRISMDVQGENIETGVEDIFSTDAPIKVIENGQLIIIRDGIKYNIQGQRL